MIFFITGILSFCSMVYELILAQNLSLFLENTVLRYTMTIGLYLFALGMGALRVNRGKTTAPSSLLRIEIGLMILGGYAVIFLFLIHAFLPRLIFSLTAHALIIAIGFLSGMELPLLMNFSETHRDQEGLFFAFNYAGAFCGIVLFAFIFYPRMGLVRASLLTGLVNGCAAGWLLLRQKSLPGRKTAGIFWTVITAGICFALAFAESLTRWLTEIYLF